MTETGKRKRPKAAAVPFGVRRVREREQYKLSQYGKLGAASPVRKIDPKTGEVVEVIEGKGTPAGRKAP